MNKLQNTLLKELNELEGNKKKQERSGNRIPEHLEGEKVICMMPSCKKKYKSAHWFSSNHLPKTHNISLNQYLAIFYQPLPKEKVKENLRIFLSMQADEPAEDSVLNKYIEEVQGEKEEVIEEESFDDLLDF